jgi:hypothetical protein
MMAEPNYCELYVDTKLQRSEIIEIIRQATCGTLDHNYVVCDWGLIYVGVNDEYSPSKSKSTNGFLYFKYIIEINPGDSGRETCDYVDGVRKLIGHFRSHSVRATAACDFEDLLGLDDEQ